MIQPLKNPIKILMIQALSMPLNHIKETLSLKTTRYYPSFSMPFPLLALAAYVRDKVPVEIEILDLGLALHQFYEKKEKQALSVEEFMEQQIKKSSIYPDVVAISSNISLGHGSLIILMKKLKVFFPNTRTIVGGSHATSFAKHIIKIPEVDHVFVGPGEVGFCSFLKTIYEGNNDWNITGLLSYQEQDIDQADPLESLDNIPIPAYDLLSNFDYYSQYDEGVLGKKPNNRSVHIKMSRGCFFKCTFCAAHTIHGRKVRERSLLKVLEEIEYLYKKYNINTVVIDDDLVGTDKTFFLELLKEVEMRFPGLRLNFPHGFSVALLDEEMIDAVMKAGTDIFVFALESGSKYVQKHIIKKHMKLDKARKLIEYATNKGAKVHAFFLLGSPGESVEMMKETIDYAKSLPLYWAYIYVAYPFLGTEMCESLLKQGIFTEEELLKLYDFEGITNRSYDTPEISAYDMNKFAYDANIEINFFNNYNLAHNPKLIIEKFSSVINHYPFHIIAYVCRALCFLEIDELNKMRLDIDAFKRLIKDNKDSAKMFQEYYQKIEEFINTSKLNKYLQLKKEF